MRRLGGKSEISVDVRVIASTNRIIEEALKKGDLREDLYYRLNVFEIALPTLRQRISDLPLLCEALIIQLNRKHSCNVTHLNADVIEAFRKYSWPGNVRELRNVLERAVIVAGEGAIQMAHLPYDFGVTTGTRTAAQVFEPESVRLSVGTTVSQAEKALIQVTLQHTKNNKTRAAEILGDKLKNTLQQIEGVRLRGGSGSVTASP